MSLQTAPLAGEIVNVRAGDAATQAAFFRGAPTAQANGLPGRTPPPNQTRAPQQPALPRVQQVGPTAANRPKPFQTRFRQGAHLNAPESAPTAHQRMAVVVWNGGWWNETADMLQGFINHDGRQERRLVLVDTEAFPVPPEVLMLAQAAFTDVQVYRCQFALANGLSTPRSLITASGFLYERLRHLGSAFYTYPLEVVAPGSLDRLEMEHREGTQSGRMILGAVSGEGPDRHPYGSFVAHREWIYDPNFPLAQGVGMNLESMRAMTYMRFEMFKSFRITKVINPNPAVAHDRSNYLQAIDLSAIPRETPFNPGGTAPSTEPGVSNADLIDSLINEANQPIEAPPPVVPQEYLRLEGARLPGPEPEPEPVPDIAFPDDATLKQLVKKHGLHIIARNKWESALIERVIYQPFLLNALAIAHKAFMKAEVPQIPVEDL